MKELLNKIKDKVTGKTSGHTRSSKWPKVRDAFLRLNPSCSVCGCTSKLEVHHIIPFHIAPARELDPTNLITLCESKKYGSNCHLLFGHLGDYKKFNPDIEKDARIWAKKISSTLVRVK